MFPMLITRLRIYHFCLKTLHLLQHITPPSLHVSFCLSLISSLEWKWRCSFVCVCGWCAAQNCWLWLQVVVAAKGRLIRHPHGLWLVFVLLWSSSLFSWKRAFTNLELYVLNIPFKWDLYLTSFHVLDNHDVFPHNGISLIII